MPETVDLLLRWTHILSAIILAGGILFERWMLHPVWLALPDADRTRWQLAVRSRWSRIIMITSALLLLSGLINAVRIIVTHDQLGGMYHGLVAVKLLLALAIFWLAAVLTGRSTTADRFRQKGTFWPNVNVALVILVVCLAGVMRMQRLMSLPVPTEAVTDQIAGDGGGRLDGQEDQEEAGSAAAAVAKAPSAALGG